MGPGFSRAGRPRPRPIRKPPFFRRAVACFLGPASRMRPCPGGGTGFGCYRLLGSLVADVPGPCTGHLPAEAAAGLAFLAALCVRRLFMPALFLELAEHALLGQLALKELDGFFNIVVLHCNLQLKSPRFLAGIPCQGGLRPAESFIRAPCFAPGRAPGRIFCLTAGGGRVIIAVGCLLNTPNATTEYILGLTGCKVPWGIFAYEPVWRQ